MRNRYVSLLALLLLAGPALAEAQQPPPPTPRPPRPRVMVGVAHERADQREEQRETFSKTVKIGNNGVLDVTNLSGNIEIRRGGGNDAVIEVTKVARGRTVEEAKAMLPLVTAEITARGERVEVKTVYESLETGLPRGRHNVNVAVHYSITAPQNTRVRVVTLKGNVKATDIRGELSLTTTSGDVTIANAARVAAAKTTSGNVELTNVDSDAALEAGALNGSVTLRNVKARRIEASCISGRVIVQNVETERLNAHTVTGQVEFSGTLARAGRYDLKSHSGNVRVEVAGGTGFELEASTFSGHVESTFTFKNADPVPGRGGRRRTITGTVGDGSASVNVTTFSGNVYVAKR